MNGAFAASEGRGEATLGIERYTLCFASLHRCEAVGLLYMRMKNRGIFGAAWVLLVAAILGDFVVALRLSPPSISSETMEKARRELETQKRPGTLIVHSPLLGVPELTHLNSIVARPDLPSKAIRGRRRILVLDRAEAPMGGFGDETAYIPIGEGLVLRIYEQQAHTTGARHLLFTLSEGIEDVKLTIERPRGRPVSRCTLKRTEGGVRCPGQPDWLYMAYRRLRVGGEDVGCVWAHPTQGGVVVLELPAMPFAEGAQLELKVRSALDDSAVRQTPNGAPVRTHVFQNGRALAQVVRANAIGWAEASVKIEPHVPVRLEVSAEHDGRRHHCLQAEIRARPQSDAPEEKRKS